jgi:hypothetical protein
MPVRKRKNRSGKVVWCYRFSAPGSTRENRKEIREFGFATKDEAVKAEAERRTKEQEKYELAKAGSAVAAAPPKTLAMVLDEFMRLHAREKLAPKTIERYGDHIATLDKGLLAMALGDLEALEERGDRSRDRVRLQRRAIRVGEDQIEVGAVVLPVLAAELVLAAAVLLEGGHRGRRQCDHARLLGLRALECQDVVDLDRLAVRPGHLAERLGNRPGDDRATVRDIGPSQSQELAAAAAGGGVHLQERPQVFR